MVETVYPGYSAKVDGVFGPSGEELGYLNGMNGNWYDRDLWVAGRMFAQSYANETYFLHANELHSDAQVTNHSGAGTLDLLYYPWGQIWTHTGYLSDAHFAGFEQGASDLYATPTRHYSNDVGRWLSPDPLGGDIMNPQSLNRYAYALNNPCTLTDALGASPCHFNIGIHNAAGLSADQLNVVEAQINGVLGAVPSTNGDTVGANFNFSGNADYTVNILPGGPSNVLGVQTYRLGLSFLPGPTNVFEGTIASDFASYPGDIAQITGTVAAHELVHRITGIGDIPFTGGTSQPPNLMQVDSYTQRYGLNVDAYYLQPNGLELTPSQASALYKKCNKEHPGGNVPHGGAGPIDDLGPRPFQGIPWWEQWFFQHAVSPIPTD